jgi:hypothetical protein
MEDDDENSSSSGDNRNSNSNSKMGDAAEDEPPLEGYER